jgi:hypothetical protein
MGRGHYETSKDGTKISLYIDGIGWEQDIKNGIGWDGTGDPTRQVRMGPRYHYM